MLQFNKSWRFSTPGAIERGVITAFHEIIEKIASQGNAKDIVEHFKNAFISDMGTSSDLGWAWTDLDRSMEFAAKNAPLFIDAFWSCCVELEGDGLDVPDVQFVNAILAKLDAGYEIQPPNLIATRTYTPVAVPRQAPSLDAQARTLIDHCLAEADRLMEAGQGRQAVQETFFLLESIATAFRGKGEDAGTIQGKYFGPIINEMKRQGKGKAQENILTWMTILHGYLSSPTGGGVRHGMDLRDGVAIRPHEARLYCNLARSYLTFLLEEHDYQHRT